MLDTQQGMDLHKYTCDGIRVLTHDAETARIEMEKNGVNSPRKDTMT
jgi:hypothetical protein